MRIIFIEDEKRLAAILKRGLEQNGLEVDVRNDGAEALDHILAHQSKYDLILLDLAVSDTDAVHMCRVIREHGISTPILILTSHTRSREKMKLLDAGADDYIVKPFALAALIARINGFIRRTDSSYPPTVSAVDLTLDAGARLVSQNGREIPLTAKEFALLEFLMRHPDQAMDRERILDHVWDYDFNSHSNVVDVHMKNLRKKLGKTSDGHEYVETVSKVGYRFRT